MKALAKHGIPSDMLELELTEGIVMQQVTDSVSRLRAIKALIAKLPQPA